MAYGQDIQLEALGMNTVLFSLRSPLPVCLKLCLNFVSANRLLTPKGNQTRIAHPVVVGGMLGTYQVFTS